MKGLREGWKRGTVYREQPDGVLEISGRLEIVSIRRHAQKKLPEVTHFTSYLFK